MDVILTQDVLDLGETGEIKRVADGYARNYLIPRGMAVLATPSARKQIADIQRTGDKRRERERGSAELLAEKFSGLALTFVARVGEGDRLYGSITSADIAEAVEKATGEELDRRRLLLNRPLKTLGDHVVPVRVAKDLTPELIVTVKRDEQYGVGTDEAREERVAPEDETVELFEETTAAESE